MQTLRCHPVLVKFLGFICLCLLLIGITLTAFCGHDRVLAPNQSGYVITGKFALNGTPEVRKGTLQTLKKRGDGIILWGSWMQDDRHTGQLVSPAFPAPLVLSLFVSGFASGKPPTQPNRLYVEHVATGEQFDLRVARLGFAWKELSWVLPLHWRNQPMRVIAIDGSQTVEGWLGLSSPLQVSFLSLLARQFSAIALVPLYVLYFALFLIPGLRLANALIERYALHSALTVILAMAISALIGYVTFWVYLLNANLGTGFSLCILLATVYAAIAWGRQRDNRVFLTTPDIALPLVLMLLVGLGYTAILYAINLGVVPEMAAQVRFFDGFPPDNVLPKLFADRLYDGKDPRPLLGEWLSSDRPPLQTGIMLVQRPLSFLSGARGLHYQILSTIAQCSWIAAMWALCRRLHFSGWQITFTLGFAIGSGFFFFNSVYVWPKLLAAALTVLAFTLLLPSVIEARRPSTTELSLAAGSAALGLLAHGGVVFTLPAIALMLVRPRSFPHVRHIIVGCLVFGILLAPWSAYQKFYEPPGDRLAKWHLAGVVNIDSRSTLQALKDSYQRLSLAQIADYKWENLKTLVDHPNTDTTSPNLTRQKEFFHLARSLGLLNFGWLLWGLIVLLKRTKIPPQIRHISLVLGVSVFSLLFWVLVMFGPATTVLHQGSYATIMLLFTGLAGVMTRLPPLLVSAMLAFQTVWFAMNWLSAPSLSTQTDLMMAPNIFLSGLAVLCLLGIGQILRRVAQVSFTDAIEHSAPVQHPH
ncbi:MAG: hypothetical protein KME27_18200 [Lyngbya sp. HA4199-MV5]|nr:hypothetical protein [Lyngbya sp. HA4199-MV5]